MDQRGVTGRRRPRARSLQMRRVSLLSSCAAFPARPRRCRYRHGSCITEIGAGRRRAIAALSVHTQLQEQQQMRARQGLRCVAHRCRACVLHSIACPCACCSRFDDRRAEMALNQHPDSNQKNGERAVKGRWKAKGPAMNAPRRACRPLGVDWTTASTRAVVGHTCGTCPPAPGRQC